MNSLQENRSSSSGGLGFGRSSASGREFGFGSELVAIQPVLGIRPRQFAFATRLREDCEFVGRICLRELGFATCLREEFGFGGGGNLASEKFMCLCGSFLLLRALGECAFGIRLRLPVEKLSSPSGHNVNCSTERSAHPTLHWVSWPFDIRMAAYRKTRCR